jgi:serine/threonine protein kinase
LYTDDKIEFDLIDLVGEGSLSAVYKALNLNDGKNLAVKIFKSDLELLYPDALVHSLSKSKESFLEDTVDELRKKIFKNTTFVEYYEYQFNSDSEEHMILMEPISLMTLNELVE